MVASLISEPTRWNDWLSQHPDRWDLFLKCFRQVVKLEIATAWPTQTVLTELGCHVQTTDELGKMEEEELMLCLEYFKWAGGMTDLLEDHRERREILSGASLLFRDGRGDLDDCKQSMKVGDFPAEELLKLGEVEKAWDTARLYLGGKIGDRARMLRDTNSLIEPQPHLSEERLDLYLDSEGGIEGEMRKRITRHLEHCTECRNACEARRTHTSVRAASAA
jgi:hypothetical protein